jgi:hypothetical protein
MKKTLIGLFCSSLLAANIFALTANDDASAYGSGWATGSNFGSGLTAWTLGENNDSTSLFAGSFIGDSSAGAADINTGTSQSFGLYANPNTAFSTATRGFASNLASNDRFTVDLALNFDNGSKGFNLRNGTTNVIGFDVGGGARINTDFTDNVTAATYDYGGNAMLKAVIQVIDATSLSYEISRTSGEGTQGVLYSGTVTGITDGIDNVEFYVSNTDNGDAENNLYFNSLAVTNVPEPAHASLLIAVVGLSVVCLIRRRKFAR